jgi:ribosomal protein S18 acetylase RimI-like enzyme
MLYSIRRATADDADAIGAMHVAAWREAYPHLLSAASLERATPESRGRRWREIIANAREGQIFVAEAEGEIVGHSSAGPAFDEDAPRALELRSIYLLARAYGSGAAQDLLDAAIGSEPARLWVAEDNPRAQAFYRRNGFAANGERKVAPFILDEVAEIRMVR